MPAPPETTGVVLQAAHADKRLRALDDVGGKIQSFSTTSFDPGPTNGFFTSLGTNGRTCNSCHVEAEGWTIAAAGLQARPPDDPVFAPVDGSDCPPTASGQGPDSSLSTLLSNFGVIRIELGVPDGAEFSLDSATNPKGCAIAPGSADNGGRLFLFRRPLPSTNLVFDTTIMLDGRETLQKITTTENEQNLDPLLFDLHDQANNATVTHAQGPSIFGTAALEDIIAFEMSLSTAQSEIVTEYGKRIRLSEHGANGGAAYIAKVLSPAFAVGLNDPLGTGTFTNTIFTLYEAWEPTSRRYRKLRPEQQAIGRGEALFNNVRFTVHDVAGINSSPDSPLFNPNDPLAGQDIVSGCGLCHNSPNIGNHSTSLPINIGVTMAQPTNNDGSPNDVLDVAQLPVYTLRNDATCATVSVTDPGRGLITGKWVDIGKTKGPILRGLASRAPYFHNGSAKDLTTVVRFYDARFDIGLTTDQIADMAAFLGAL